MGFPGSDESFGLTWSWYFARARGSRGACFLVVADVEGALDDEADYLRREVGEMRGERCGEGVEVVALVGVENSTITYIE